MHCGTPPRWEALLVSYLSGAGDIAELYLAAKTPLRRMVVRIASHLPEDIQEDAIQEVFVRLLENPPQSTHNCSIRTLTFGLLRNAVRHTRALYVRPGEKTRANLNEQISAHPRRTLVKSGITATVGDEANAVTDITAEPELDQLPSPRWTASSVEAFAEAGELLSRLSPSIAKATWMIHVQGYSLAEAANSVGLSRFSLMRSLKHLPQGEDSKLNKKLSDITSKWVN